MRTHMHCIHAHAHACSWLRYCGAIPSELSHTARRTEVSPRPGVASPRTRHTLSGSFDGGRGLSDDGLWGLGPCGVWRLWRSASGDSGAPWGGGALPCRDK